MKQNGFVTVILIMVLTCFGATSPSIAEHTASIAPGSVDVLDIESVYEEIEPFLSKGVNVENGYYADPHAYFLTSDEHGNQFLSVLHSNDEGFTEEIFVGPIQPVNGNKAYIEVCTDRSLVVSFPGAYYATFALGNENEWKLTYMLNDNDQYGITDNFGVYRIDGSGLQFYPGESTIDITVLESGDIPLSFIAAAQAVNEDGFAKINNTDPTKRLYLRSEPSEDAYVLGKYYNGTPVQVLSKKDGWSRVNIAGKDGYVASSSLTYGQAMEKVVDAFPFFEIKKVESIDVYNKPTSDAAQIIAFDPNLVENAIVAIGEIGDGWYHVISTSGQSGYVQFGI